jgi:transposase
MSRGHSLDLRSRVIALIERGLSRRAAARQLMIGESSAIKWFKLYLETGVFAERPGRKKQYSPLESHAPWLLALVKAEPDLTLAEIVLRLDGELGVKITDSSVARFFQRHGVSYKKNASRQRAEPAGRRQGARGMAGGARSV